MGLILLGLPAAFEILFVVAIFVLLHQAEADIKQESHSREVTAHAHNLAARITTAGISIGAYSYSKSALARQTYQAAIKGMHNELAALRELLEHDTRQLARLSNINDTAASTLKKIEFVRSSIETSPALALLSGNSAISDALEELSGVSGKMQQQIDDLVHAEQAAHRNLPARRARSRQQVMIALIAGALLNIALAVMLASFFSRTIAKRHQVLIDNTRRLAKAETLHRPLEGDDEIAQLDSVFHNMVRDLERADQFKKELIGMASHELRAPLTSIDAILTFLEAGGMGELPSGVISRLQTAEREVSRLIALINDLLDVERMEAGKFEMTFSAVALSAILKRGTASVEAAGIRKGITISIPAVETHVWADEDRLIQVIVNLLSNAIKFSPQNGKIEITIQEFPDEAVIRISDQGRGVPESYKSRVFERFTQVEKSDAKVRGGSGLGLTICKAIVLQHGGQIGVESEEGRGATFWFSVPREDPTSLGSRT